MAVDFQKIWNYYSRESILRAIIDISKNREVVSVFADGRFGKRPDVIQYPQDVVQAISEGTVSFHGSVERWEQPMKLDVGMSKPELDKLRIGWDIFIDPDVADLEISKIVVKQIFEALKDHGVQNISIKFTGGKGFHVGIPFESMPEKMNMLSSSSLFPDLLANTIEYLKWYLKDQLQEEILSVFSAAEISQIIKKPMKDIMDGENVDIFKFVSMDIFSSRHLFRLPYSLHESTMLVSLPIKIESLEKFEREQAAPEKVKIEERFLVPKVNRDAEGLMIEVLDWAAKHKREVREEIPKPYRQRITKAVPEEYFPPCIKMILNGLTDGKKRAVFVLINFLRNMGWDLDRIEKRLEGWNEKNIPPLRSNYLRTQLRWHFRQDRNLLPPNCDNPAFYQSMGVFDLCKELHEQGIKNPVNYPLRKMNQGRLKIKKR